MFAKSFGAESALVSPLITCGTHAITLALFGVLRPNDTLLAYGSPYDTLKQVISGKNNGSLADFKVKYVELPMERKANPEKIALEVEKHKPKMFYLQRSKGYSKREDAINIAEMKAIFDAIRKKDKNVVIMVDNCYGEFLEEKEPTEIGADIIAGSLIKNAGGGIAPTGGYVIGKKKLIEQIAGRLTAPTLRGEVGSYSAPYTPYFEGFFIAPHVVSRAMKGSMLLGKVFESLGFATSPNPNKVPKDFVRSVTFNDKEKLIKFCQLVQKFSPVDSHFLPLPWEMPGYKDDIIMASGSFTQGSSIELSCDGPIRPPYIAYIQGGLTYEHLKLLAIEILISKI